MAKNKKEQMNNLRKANLKERLALVEQFEKNYKKTVEAGSLMKDQMQYEKISTTTKKIRILKNSVSKAESNMSSILKKEVRNAVGRLPPEPPCKNKTGIIEDNT